MTIGRIPSVEGGIQPTIVDAKGDLIAGVAADSVNRLAVGSNDQVLVADSSASTGLAWKSVATPFAAGKNKIINGDFGIWQRGTSFTNPSAGSYSADRFFWAGDGSGATRTISQQSFTPGTAPVAGYEGSFFWRMAQTVAGTGAGYNGIAQRIEDVRTLAGQTVTFSFWAKANASLSVGAQYGQIFGSGGSSNVYGNSSGITISTSWQRYSWTVAIPSVSGKTIGSGSFLEIYILFPVNAIQTIDIWGWQLEAGNVATAFQTATGTLQGELAACQRYYYRTGTNDGNSAYGLMGYGQAYNSTGGYCHIPLPTTMRVKPTTVDTSAMSAIWFTDGINNFTPTSIVSDSNVTNRNTAVLIVSGSGFTQFRFYQTTANNTGSPLGFIGVSAEL